MAELPSLKGAPRDPLTDVDNPKPQIYPVRESGSPGRSDPNGAPSLKAKVFFLESR